MKKPGLLECGICKSRGHGKTIIQVFIMKTCMITTDNGSLIVSPMDDGQEELVEMGMWLRCQCARCGNELFHYEQCEYRPIEKRLKARKKSMKSFYADNRLEGDVILECRNCHSKKTFLILFDAPMFVYMDDDNMFFGKVFEGGRNITNQAIMERLKLFLSGEDPTPGVVCKKCGESDVNVIPVEERVGDQMDYEFDKNYAR